MSTGAVEVAEAMGPGADPTAVVATAGGVPLREVGAALAASDLQLVGEVADVDALGASEATVVLLPAGRVTPKLLKQIREAAPDLCVVAVAAEGARREVRRAVQAGIDGMVREAEIAATLEVTIRAVCAGQLVVPRESRSQLPAGALSYREKQILGMVVMGYTNAEIGQRLFLAESTVKSHLSSSFAKLGVRSRNEAAAAIMDPNGGLGPGILAITEEATGQGEYSSPQVTSESARRNSGRRPAGRD
jgi:DNA-binding NarL/FixJ family response regulator